MDKSDIIVCYTSQDAYRFLERSFPGNAGIHLAWERKPDGPAFNKAILCLFEIKPPESSVSQLRRFVRNRPGPNIITFSMSGSVRMAVESIRAGAGNFFSLPGEKEGCVERGYTGPTG
jgi:hypothetical protein